MDRPALVIVNPRAGRKFGLSTIMQAIARMVGLDERQDHDAIGSTLAAAGIRHEIARTRRAGQATELARAAAAEGRALVIAAGGDGTVEEVARGLVGSETVLGILPLGTMMNVARTLSIPLDLDEAARTIAAGNVLAVDMGRVGESYFMETAGIGVDAILFGYYREYEHGASALGLLRAGFRFLRGLGAPLLELSVDDRRWQVHAPMVVVANSPYVGAVYAIAPTAEVDSGFLEVMVFRHATVARVLLYLALVAGGRRRRPPPEVRTFRARSIGINALRRPLPVHADGRIICSTPAHFSVVPACLKVIVGPNEETAA